MKKIIVISLGILLLLTGCSASTETFKAVNDALKGDAEITTGSEMSTESNDSKSNGQESVDSVEYIGNNQLANLTDFSEGKALVQFEDYSEVSASDVRDAVKAIEGSDQDRIDYVMRHLDDDFQGCNRVALIDTQGKIIWKSEFTKENTALREVSEFRGGLAYFIFNGNEKSTYNIIDSEGNVTFTRDFTEDFMILGHGDGLFLVAEHIVDFDRNEWQVGAMDRNGIMVVEYKTYETDTAPEPPESVEHPVDYSGELQDIEDLLSQLESEYQAWLEECWDYQGETDAEYYKRTNAIEEDFHNRRMKLEERRQQLMSEYAEQSEKYEEYQDELSAYETDMNNYVPKTMCFDMNANNRDYYRSCEYLGDNIYKLNFGYGFEVLNIDTQNIINHCNYSADSDYIKYFITGFENGTATVVHIEPFDTESITVVVRSAAQLLPTSICSVCSMDKNGMLTPVVTNIWTKYVLEDKLYDNKFSDGLLFIPYSQGEDMTVCIDMEYYATTGDEKSAREKGFVFQTGVYYNIEGEVVIDFPEYRGKKEYVCSPFYNGYAVMQVKGADQLMYFTVINKDGNFMFELKSGFDNAYISKDGKYVTAVKSGSLTVFDINGEPLTSIDCINIRPSSDSAGYSICNGVIRFNGMHGFYVNIENGTIIGSTFIDANDLIVTKH